MRTTVKRFSPWMRIGQQLVWAAATLFAITLPSDAHDFWIEPTLFQPDVDERTGFNLRVGQELSGDTLPWVPQWFIDYRVIGPEGAEPVRGIVGDIPAGGFEPSDDALYVVGYLSVPDLADLEPEKFNEYLQKEGLEPALEKRIADGKQNEPGREFYSRCAKSLIKAGSGSNTAALSTFIGYPLEIVPVNNPYNLDEGQTLQIKILAEKQPIQGLSVFAFNAAEPDKVQRVATDEDGFADINIDRKGTWLIKAVRIYEIENPAAEWESYWASLTFRL